MSVLSHCWIVLNHITERNLQLHFAFNVRLCIVTLSLIIDITETGNWNTAIALAIGVTLHCVDWNDTDVRDGHSEINVISASSPARKCWHHFSRRQTLFMAKSVVLNYTYSLKCVYGKFIYFLFVVVDSISAVQWRYTDGKFNEIPGAYDNQEVQ